MITHSSAFTASERLAPALMRCIKNSSPSKRWVIATMISVLSLVIWRSGKAWCIVVDGSAYYCSRDCQKAAWSEHKEECKEKAEQNAKFKHEREMLS
jgi:hypothetical protein